MIAGGTLKRVALPAVAAVLVAAFVALAYGVGSGSALYATGHQLSRELAETRGGALVAAMLAVTTIGDPGVLALLTAVAGLVLVYRRRDFAPLLALVVSLGGAAGLEVVVKSLVTRGRPGPVIAIYTESTYAFPSGHATRTTAACVMLAALVALACARWWIRLLTWFGAVAVGGAVGVSRVVLGVHWPTDVLGGWLLGTVWALLCVAAGHAIARRQGLSFPGRLPGGFLLRG